MTPTAAPPTIEDVYRLTPVQRGMLFHTLLAPGAGQYVTQITCVLCGALDPDAFERAWAALVRRHPALRTAFVWEGVEEPVQVVLAEAPLALERADWRALGERERAERLEAHLEADRRRGFDLAAAPLMRVLLARVPREDGEAWRLVWSAHHLLFDGWSLPILWRELFEHLAAEVQGAQVLDTPPRPYGDYLRWLAGRDVAAARGHWRAELADRGETARLPFVRPAAEGAPEGAGAADGWGDEVRRLDPARTARLLARGRALGVTLATLVHGAWALVLGRASGADELVLGSARAGRPPELEGVESMVGMFLATVPLRVPLPAQASAGAWLRDLQERSLRLAAHEWLPLPEIAALAGAAPGELFESLVVVESYPLAAAASDGSWARAGFRLEDLRYLDRTSYPLNLIVQPPPAAGGELELRLAHPLGRVAPAEAAALTDELVRVLGALATADGATRLAALLAPTSSQRGRLLGWGDGGASSAAPAALAAAFEAVADAGPGRVAWQRGDERRTYAELDADADRLARALRARGLARGALVAVAARDGAELALAALGVAKAGAAFLPLDPALPGERARRLVAGAGAAWLLASPELTRAWELEHLPALDLADPALRPPAGRPGDEDGPAGRLGLAVAPDELAYVIHTSGSTGAPKAVEVPHRGLAGLARATADVAGLGPGRRVAQLASIGFDVAVLELVATLLSGATLVALRPEERVPGPRLAAALRAGGVDTLFLAPAVLRELAPEDVPGLATLVVGGESLTPELAARWRGRALVHAYGPAEATVTAVHGRVDAHADGRPLPLGRPLPGVRALVLRDAGGDPTALAPPGAVGELVLGGAGIARGYRGRPRETAERFVPDPWGAPGARLYRTGDLVRWRPEAGGGARLEFVGRADEQLKVRGVRVEPGEVEAALLAHPGVRQAAVDAVPAGTGAGAADRRLVAWVVAREGADPAALRAFLAERLPPALVPSRVVLLAELPCTPSGKLDRAALRARADEPAAAVPAPPRTALERWLLARWAEVLGQDAEGGWGLEDDFFERGGDSLRALQLVARVRDALGIDLPLRALFEAPRAGELARRIEELGGLGGLGGLRGLGAPDEVEGSGDLGGLEDTGAETPEQALAGALPSIAAAAAAAPRSGVGRPLSFAQERLWFLHRLDPGSPAYLVPFAVRLTGPLDPDALERALQGIVARHEVLGARIALAGEEPRLVPDPSASLRVPRIDLRGLPAGARRARSLELALADARRPLDLGTAPLLRATLHVLDGEQHVLVLVLHHAVADGWSLGVLVRELSVLYAAAVAGRPAELPPLQVQVADHALWQRDPRVRAAVERDVASWKAELAGVEPVLELPLDRPRPAVQSLAGRTLTRAVEPELRAAVEALARELGATPFMVLLAAFQAWLGELTGRRDFLVGTPVAGRERTELEGLVGLFVNTLPIRAELGGDPAFRELVARVRRRTLDAHARQRAPFERLVEELVPGRDLARPPLVQVLFVLQDGAAPAFALPGLAAEPLALDTGTAKFDLSLLVDPRAGGWELSFELATAILREETVGAWADGFVALLRAAAADPGRRLSRLTAVSGDERRRLLELGREPGTHPRDATVPALFAAQVARTPEAIAVACGDARLSYRELDELAERLARRLAGLGVGPEVRVGVCTERSLAMVTAILAVLKAGGAYVPLDPAYPPERRRRMLEDAGVTVVLATHARAEELRPALADVPLVTMDPFGRAEGAEGAAQAEPTRPRAEHLAYVMFTSGSTGTPKGVGVTHRSIARLLCGRPPVPLGPGDVLLQFVSFSFDVSVLELWGALLFGGRLEVFPPHTPSLAELGAFVRERGVTTLWLTTGLFDQMVEERPEDLRGLRHLLAGGEALSAVHVRRALELLPDTRIVNGYGPTEVTCFTTTHTFGREGGRDDDLASVPIGRPVNGTQVYVLDERQRLVPRGAWGELWAAGDGLARGYLNDACLTAERFLPDPFADEPGARMYRIGDRVRWRADGALDFGGRLDRQVKIRGFRLEPGEVEAALDAHPAVRKCVVEPRGTGAARHLVAWYAAAAELDPGELRAFLRGTLPEPMLPTRFVRLDALPLTPNGKVDRRALPEPRQTAHVEGEAPRGLEEELLAALWRELLEVDEVARDDDFFALGGHSLLATRLVVRMRALFGVEPSLQAVFQAPTLAEMAALVTRARGAGELAADEPLPAEGGEDAPLSSAQERLAFLERLEPGNPAHHSPFALELTGPLDRAALEGALADLARRHPVLRTSLPEVDGRRVQRVAPPADADLRPELVDLAALPPGERAPEAERRRAACARAPFDLERGPLARVLLLRHGPERHELCLVLHHAACDGWSVGLLVHELGALYGARRAGTESGLAEPATTFAAYACWQRARLEGGLRERELAWWTERLAGVPERIELGRAPEGASAATRGPRPAAGLSERLDPELVRRVAELARREGMTPFLVHLACLQAVLGRFAGATDLVVGAPVAGRTRRELEDVVGPFVGLLPLRADLSGDPSLRALLARVRAGALDAFDHQELPVEELAHVLRPGKGPRGRGSELFQVLFTLHSAPRPPVAFAGLAARRLPVAMDAAFCELWLSLEPVAAGEGEPGAWEVYWHYDVSILARERVERIAAAWRRALSALLEDPERRLSRLPLVAQDERERLAAFGAGPWTYPRAATVHGLFAELAARQPERAAVACGAEVLSYGELERSANRLARRLQALGAVPEARVGVLLERSLDLVVAQLAVLKAGGAYVPLDPAWPAERWGELLGAAGATLVVTTAALADELPAGAGWPILLDEERALLAELDGAPLPPPGSSAAPASIGPRSLAYVMSTSGTTGRPKVVGVEHRSIVRLARGATFADLSPADTVLHLAPAAFDAATFELWGALLSGARLEVLPPGTPSLSELARFLRERGVTVAWLTAGLFHQMVDEAPEGLTGLRLLVAGGEALSPAHVARALAGPPARGGGRLVNGYGPTECTTFAATHVLAPGEDLAAGVPVGRPIEATVLRVLDAHGELAPIGTWGELFAGGDGLARGYLNDPAATAAAFVPDPWSEQPGARLYRTGDRARWRADGVLELGGRLDRQVKLRGFRIEPGEVEARLCEHPRVARAAVDVRERAGERRLVAWLTALGEAPSAAELRAFLAARLPAPLVPASFVVLEELPLTANGKLDRAALREEQGAPGPGGADRVERAARLSTPEEQLLAELFGAVLGVEHVGPDDDFFELGGHSLLATRLASRVREAFGVELPLHVFLERPRLADLAAAVAEARAAGDPEPTPPLRPRPGGGDAPLSSAQARLLFAERLAPGDPTYHVPFALELEGELDDAALGGALRALVRRHEVLRTCFPAEDGVPVQRVLPPDDPACPQLALEDLSGLAPAERRARAGALVRELATAPFDLAAAPPLRARLLRLAAREHVLVLALHHIACDGWSWHVLANELSSAYAALAAGEEPRLAPLAVQVADHAAWQRELLAGARLERLLGAWTARLGGPPERLELSTRARRRVSGARPARLLVAELPAATAQAAARLARAEGATPFHCLLAAFQALLARVAGRTEVVVGAPVAGRTRRELEGLIGCFLNTLPLRADLAGAPDFRTLLRHVRDDALEAFRHEELPLERWVEESAGARAATGEGPLQVLFNLQSTPAPELSLPGLAARVVPLETGAAHAELSLTLEPRAGGGLAAAWEADAELLAEVELERLHAAYVALLDAVLADPAARPLEVPLLSPAERAAALEGGRGRAGGHPRDAGLAALYAEVAREHGASPAVLQDGRVTTHAELAARAHGLALRLARLGLAREELVGLATGRADELAAGALAVLRAGGAYLPLDPAAPDARQARILSDARARLVLAPARDAERWRALGATPVALDDPPGTDGPDEPAPSLPPLAELGGGDLAYAAYTSGSTGAPKGVLVPQRAVTRLVLGSDFLVVGPGERVGRAANPAFDATTFELWAPLLAGGVIVDLPRELVLAPDELAAALRERGVQHLFLTTALFQETVRARPEAFATLDTLLFGGERCQAALVRRCLEAGAPRRLLHVYGPTEATTFAAFHEVRAEDVGAGDVDPGQVPIGGPLAGTELLVLDERLEPVPDGHPGELLAGGDALARGYLGRGAASAASFVPHPARAGERLYRTGDLVRRDARGRLVFLGRRDAQLKLRGFRIEPDEVEAALAEHARVRAAAVALRAGPGGDPRLVAWIVAVPGTPAPDAAELRRHLAARLPEPMVPAAFVALDALPLGATGKLDRAALPEPDWDAAAVPAGASRRPAQDPLADLAAETFAAVLELAEAPPHDASFFDLGGHSLAAARAVTRFAEAVGRAVPVRALFEDPTAAGLAAAARAAAAEGGPAPAPIEVDPLAGREGPLSFAQERLWFLERLVPGSALYVVPFALRLTGPLDRGAWRAALAHLARRHEALRTRVEPGRDGTDGARQLVAPDPPLPFAELDLADLPRAEAERVLGERLRREAATGFDLAAGPPWRTLLARVAADEHVALFVLHHAFTDGWSLGVLARELAGAYGALAAGRTPEPAPLPVQPLDHARWQRAGAGGAAWARDLAWWSERLAGAPDALALPLDRPRAALSSFAGASVPLELPEEVTAELRAFAREAGATPFVVLYAAVHALLARWTGADDVCVGTPVAGRERPELEGVLGFLVDTVVLRTACPRGTGFRELVRRCRATLIETFEHRAVPFERVVEAVAPRRDTSRNPLFQVMLAVQDGLAEPPRLPGLEVEELGLSTGTAKFDLSIALRREGGRTTGEIEYAAELFERATVERLARRLERLIARAVRRPELPLDELDWLPEEERGSLERFARGLPARPAFEPVHLRFTRHAAERPDAPAVADERGAWSYGELDGRSGGVAVALLGLGVGRGEVVGVLAERSRELVAGALGALRAGAAYLALDPALPAGRLRELARDARVRVVLATERLAPAAEELERAGTRLAWLERLAPCAGGPAHDVRPQDLAYVVYTSGSTGRPKGVAVPHGGLARLVDWHLRALAVGPEDRATLLAGTSFDASVWELWPYLAAGASLFVVPDPVRADPPRLIAELERARVTRVFLPTPLAEAALQEAWPASSPLRTLLTGGDRLHAAPPPGLSFELVNCYGPSEASVVATAGPVAPGSEAPSSPASPPPSPPSIGRPIDGARVHLFDERLRPVPIGAPGELFVGGAGVALGYLGCPRETAAAFVPDPFADEPGARLYRTGDLARWLSDGSLAFLGRRDDQVQVRGQRVEPGEVECRLAALEGVREAAVVARRGPDGDVLLAAYVVPRHGTWPGLAELEARLREELPASHVPAAWAELAALPKGPSGKLDRDALPAPAPLDELDAAEHVPPATATERAVAAIWAGVLGRERVSCTASFFDLGGHSLALLRVAARLRAELGRDVPVAELFLHPTVRALARRLDAEERVVELSPAPPPEPSRARGAERATVRGARRAARRRLEEGT